MTFDDGILTIYEAENGAEPGRKPVIVLKEKSKHYYGYDELGVTRYYQAKSANQKIECVVSIPDWHDIRTTDLCRLDGGDQYQVAMVQPTKNEDGLRIMRLSLERVGQDYEVP